MEEPQVTDAHRRLGCLIGAWMGDEMIHDSAWGEAGTAVGRAFNRWGLDGFAVIHDYEQLRGARVAYRGHGIFRYRPADDVYVLHWFDSMGASQELSGGFDDDVLRLGGSFPGGESRASWDFAEDGVCAYRMEARPDDGDWQTYSEARLIRND